MNWLLNFWVDGRQLTSFPLKEKEEIIAVVVLFVIHKPIPKTYTLLAK